MFTSTTNNIQQHMNNKKKLCRLTGEKGFREKSRDQMPVYVKHIKFTIGITDFDRIKGRRIPGGSFYEEGAILVINQKRGEGRTGTLSQ